MSVSEPARRVAAGTPGAGCLMNAQRRVPGDPLSPGCPVGAARAG